jgi:hypothetical protein
LSACKFGDKQVYDSLNFCDWRTKLIAVRWSRVVVSVGVKSEGESSAVSVTSERFSAGVIGGTVGLIVVVITATCLGARFVAARTKRHFPPADNPGKEEEVHTSSSPSSTEDIKCGFMGDSSRKVSMM